MITLSHFQILLPLHLYFALPMKLQRSVFIGAAAVSIAAALWGFDGVVLTPRLHNLDIGYVVFMVHAIPFVLMNIFLFRAYRVLRHMPLSDIIIFILVAITGGAIGTLAIVKALFLVNFRDLTVVVLLQKLQPVFAITLAAIILHERLRKNFLLWAATAILASYLLTFGLHLPNFSTGSKTVHAALFALLAAFSFGSSTVLSKKILLKYDFKTATFFRYGLTALLMFIYILTTAKLTQIGHTTSMNWLIFIIIAFTTGSGAIFLYYFGLNRIKASVSTICELSFPLSAIVFDYVFNGNVLGVMQWVGAIILIIAIINLNRVSVPSLKGIGREESV
jgi:drug/metabolite transporter (DMT)-like permease